MKFATNVSILQTIVGDLSKGVGNDKSLPITSMLGIECLPNKEVVFTVTDYANYMTISLTLDGDDEEYEEGFATVTADMFIKLVQKCKAKDEITFETLDNCLVVGCGGVYKLELCDDGSGLGEAFHFTSPIGTFPTAGYTEYLLDRKTIDSMIDSCKQALYPDKAEIYSKYLVADKVVATDRTRAVFVDSEVANGKPHIVLDSRLVDLMTVFSGDATLKVTDDSILVTNANGVVKIYSKTKSDLESYDENGLNNMLGMKFPSMCKVDKSELVSVINKMGLFCTKYEDNALRMDFKENSLILSSIKDAAVEEIEYIESMDIAPFSLYIDITRLLAHLKAYSGDVVTLYFGAPKCIKLEEDNVVQIIALVAR